MTLTPGDLMKTSEFERRMRAMEIISTLQVPPDAYTIVRVDGRAFRTLTAQMEKPFSTVFHAAMVETTRRLVEDLGALVGYTESDEISILLPRSFDQFGRRIEKIVSITAGQASTWFSCYPGISPGVFDGRVSVAAGLDIVIDYFRWRQNDAMRCAAGSMAFYHLVHKGQTPREAHRALKGKRFLDRVKMLRDDGVDYFASAPWKRLGTVVHRPLQVHQALDPRTNRIVEVSRRHTVVDESIPISQAYSVWLTDLVVAQEIQR